MKNKYLKIIIASLAVGCFMSVLFLAGFFASWRAKFTDKLFLASAPDKDIVIIAIDNDSLQKIGRWPWDRKVHAALLKKISELKPTVIGYDVNFPEKSDPASDQALADAIKQAGNVILPVEAAVAVKKNKITATDFLAPIEIIKQAARGLGLTNTPPDQDGIFRKLPVNIFDDNGREKISFANLIANQYFLAHNADLAVIPTDKSGYMAVNFFGRPKTFPMIPVSRVLEGGLPAETLRDKIVLIGATAPDLHDEQMTPTSGRTPMSGVEIHANAIGTIIEKNFLQPLGRFKQILIFIGAAFIVGLIILSLKLRLGSVLVLIMMAGYVAVAVILFDYRVVLDIFYFILTSALAYLAAVSLKYVLAAQEKKFIKETFNRYVSPEIINELIKYPEKIKLGGEQKEITTLFSDVRGFTSISEKLTPEQLVGLLNKYLTGMSDIIMADGGVIDKYIGDAIMAFWGAPLPSINQAERACRSALSMIGDLAEKKSVWQKEFGVELNIGIGVNTGEVIVGNMGSDKRFDYTVMGDAVNLASRLESLTKLYGVNIIASQFTKERAGAGLVFCFLDKVAVKGKAVGVDIFELVGQSGEVDENTAERIRLFQQAVNLYFSKQWDGALKILNEIILKYPVFATAGIYYDRCQEFKTNPPPENWDGVYHLNIK